MTTAVRNALAALSKAQDLPREAMADVVREIMAGSATDAQIGALLLGLAQKGETLDEIVGAATAMREAAHAVPSTRRPLLDTCGTGGSGVSRRNVSTAVALVVAGCGVAVAKHGNRAASSRSGSADVLEALGVRLDLPPAAVGQCIDREGLGFLFAPHLHPAMRHAAGPRRELGVRTIFNLLGPLTNPAGATHQLMGVFDPRRVEALAGALAALGSERVWVVHGFRDGVIPGPDAPPGIDDLSTEGASWVAIWDGERVATQIVVPEDAGLPRVPWSALAGGTPAENADAVRALLDGAPGGYRTAVVLSAAAALVVAEGRAVRDLPAQAARAAGALDDGAAKAVLQRLVTATHRAVP